MEINEDECRAAGIDPKKVLGIARRLRRVAADADAMGIHIFGGSGTGSLRFRDGSDHPLVLADGVAFNVDGGDGATYRDDSGLLRGE